MEKQVNIKNFEENVNVKGVVVVDFYANWCGPCRMLAPVLEEISDKTNIPILKVNVDNEIDLSNTFNITNIPAVKIFKDGKLVKEFVGYRDYNEVEDIIKGI